MKNKKLNLLVLSAIATLGLAACGGNEVPVASSTSEVSSSEVASSSDVTSSSSSSSASESSSSSSTGDVTSSTGGDVTSSSSTGEVVATHHIFAALDHVTLDGLPTSAAEGDTVSFTASVEPGYELTGLRAVCNREDVPMTVSGANYSFVMPGGDVVFFVEDDLSTYELNYTTGEGLTVTAYKAVAETDLAVEDLADVAGVYTGYVASTNANYPGYNVTLTVDHYGSFTLHAEYEGYDDVDIEGTTTALTAGEGTAKVVTGVQLSYSNGNQTPSFTLAKDESGNVILTFTTFVINYYDYTAGNKFLTKTGDVDAPSSSINRPVALDEVPDHGTYQSSVYYGFTGNNYYTFAGMSVDGEEVSPISDGSYFDGLYKLDVTYHASDVVFRSATRYADINIYNDDGITVTAYTRDGTGSTEDPYVYTEVTEAVYEEQLYFKADVAAGYALDFFNIQYNTSSWTSSVSLYTETETITSAAEGETTEGEEATSVTNTYYYSSNTEMANMDLGMNVYAHASPLNTTLTSAAGAYYANIGSTYVNDVAGKGDGNKISISTGSSTGSTIAWKETETDGLLDVKVNNSETSYKGWTNGEGLYIFDSNANGLGGSYIVYAGANKPTVSYHYYGNSVSSSTLILEKLSFSDGSAIEFAIIANGSGRVTDVKFDITFTTISGEDHDSVGSAYYVYDAEGNELGLFKNTSSTTLGNVVLGPAGSYTCADDEGKTLVIDETGMGVSYGTTGSETSVYNVSFGENEDGTYLASFLIVTDSEVLAYNVSIDPTAGTYSKIAGKPFGADIVGQYVGARVSVSSSGVSSTSYFKMGIANSVSAPTTGTWESSSNYLVEFNVDGTFTIGGSYTVVLSEDGETAFVTQGSYMYLLSKSITRYSSGVTSIKSMSWNGGYLVELLPSSSSNGSANHDPFFYNGSTFVPATLTLKDETVDWYTSGSSFSLVIEGTTYDLYNSNGTIINAVKGTFVISETESLTIADGVLTYGGVSYSCVISDITTTSAIATFSSDEVVDGETITTTYTATLNLEAMTATVTSVKTKDAVGTYTISYPSSHPWVDNNDGTYTSAGANSSTSYIYITADADGTISFDYDIGSESGYDYMTISTYADSKYTAFTGYSSSSSDKSNNSGVVTGTFSTAVTAGTTIAVGYYKDGSGAENGDRVIISNIVAIQKVVVE